MKILHISNCFNSNPLYSNLFRSLAHIGVDQSIYCAEKKSRMHSGIASWAEDFQYKVSHLVTSSDRILFRSKIRKITRDLECAFDVSSYDLIHAHTLYSDGAVANLLSKKYKIPFVVAFRNTDINYFRRFRPDLKLVEKEIVNNSKCLFSISKAYANNYGKSFSRQITTIPNGIDELWFDATKLVDESTPASAGEINILSVSDLSPNKNIETLIEAVRLARLETKRDFRLTVVGGTESRISFYSHYMQKRNYSFVKMLGRIDDRHALRSIYTAHDFFALPSRFETFGLVYVEALSQGLPIIFSRGQGVDGFFNNDSIMQAVDCDDIADVTRGIIMISRKIPNAKIACIAEAARFRWPQIALQYYSEYNKVLSCQ